MFGQYTSYFNQKTKLQFYSKVQLLNTESDEISQDIISKQNKGAYKWLLWPYCVSCATRPPSQVSAPSPVQATGFSHALEVLVAMVDLTSYFPPQLLFILHRFLIILILPCCLMSALSPQIKTTFKRKTPQKQKESSSSSCRESCNVAQWDTQFTL